MREAETMSVTSSLVSSLLDAVTLSGSAPQPLLAEAGLEVEREHPTGEGGCVLLVARLIQH